MPDNRRILNSKSLSEYTDDEFGTIRITHNRSGYIALNIRTNGELVLSVSGRSNKRTIAEFIDNSRPNIRQQLSRIQKRNSYSNGDKIGRSHRLVIRSGVRPDITITDGETIVTVTNGETNISKNRQISDAIAKTLKLEAKHYLPKRLRYYALKYGFSYSRIRLTYAKSRWGSCSSNGTISLNIALMRLPDELSDYVILHELNHTRHMNHAYDFWSDLVKILPDAKTRRDQLRSYTPYI